MNPSLRTLSSFQAGMTRLGGISFVITPGQGTWNVETRDRRGDGRRRAPSTSARRSRCSPPTATRSGMRAFAEGKDLAADLAEAPFKLMAELVRQAVHQPGVGDEPSLPGARRLEDDGRPRRAARRQVRAVVGLPPARAAAGRAGRGAAHGGAARHGSRGAAPRGLRAARSRSWTKARAAGRGLRRLGERDHATAPPRSPARTCSTPRNGARAAYYGDAEAEAALRAAARRLARARVVVRGRARRTATSCTACPCGATSPWPTRCSTGRAAAWSARPTTAWSSQMAVLHRLLKGIAMTMIGHKGEQAVTVRALRGAAPYIRMYKGKIFVIKTGGGAFRDGATMRALRRADRDPAPPRHPRRAGARRRAAARRR